MAIIKTISDLLWGMPLIVLILLAGIIFTVGSKFFQIAHLKHILKNTIGTLFSKKDNGKGMMKPLEVISIAVGGAVGVGNIGGVAATLGVVFPSLIIISLLAGVITTFAEVAWVKNAFAGIRVCVCVLIFNAVVKLWKKSVVDKKTLALYALILLASLLTDLSPVIFVLFAAVSGIVLQVALKKGGEAE